MKPKKGGLYRTICGTIIHFQESAYHGQMIAVNGCTERQCGYMTYWGYTTNGLWGTKERVPNFHLHLVEEILP